MISQSQAVNRLHQIYCQAMFLDDFELNMADERRWLAAADEGLTPDDLKLLIKDRLQGIRKDQRRPACVCVRNICGSEEAIADALNEVAMIKARMRVKVLPRGKAEVLRATGRDDAPSTSEAKAVGDIALIQQLRKAANE